MPTVQNALATEAGIVGTTLFSRTSERSWIGSVVWYRSLGGMPKRIFTSAVPISVQSLRTLQSSTGTSPGRITPAATVSDSFGAAPATNGLAIQAVSSALLHWSGLAKVASAVT